MSRHARSRGAVRRIAACAWVAVGVALSSCANVLGVESISVGQFLGVQVRGLWDGAGGVRLRLKAEEITEEVTVGNGEQAFTTALARSDDYAVTVVESPALHQCRVEGTGRGTVTDAAAAPISIACTGPAVTIDTSLPGWTFDPSAAEQSLDTSVFDESVAITVGGAVTTAAVDGAAVALGVPVSPVALPFGPKSVAVAVAAGALTRTYRLTFVRGGALLAQREYGKAPTITAGSALGAAIAVDGDRIVIGAPLASLGSGGPKTGTAFVFVRDGSRWFFDAILRPSGALADDRVGCAVAISGDTIALGADGTDSSDAEGSTIPDAGAAYVFVRTGSTWMQQASFIGNATAAGVGRAIAVSGNTLVVGAPGVNGGNDGVASVYVRSGTTWTLQTDLAGTSSVEAHFGAAVAIEGDTIAATAVDETSSGTARGAGAAYVFARSGTAWTQQARLTASNSEANDHFGTSVALSGGVLAVGAAGEDSTSLGGATDNGAVDAGAVYVFVSSGTAWSQQAGLKAANAGAGDRFGSSVALRGETLVVGAPGEQSAATGIGGNESDDSATAAGAAYLFVRSGAVWTQASYIKASNTDANDQLGSAVAVSSDYAIAGAPGESSASTSVDGDQTSNAAAGAGAFYIYR